MSTTTFQTPSPGDDSERFADEVEAFLADQSAQTAPVATVPEVEVESPREPTKRVKRLAADLTEADDTLELLADGDPRLDVPSGREQRTLRKAAAAMRMYELSQTPALVAARDARVRKWATGAALVSAVMALSWSTAGVQASVAKAGGLETWSAGWIAAWLVEPMMSLLLLALVGAQAYAAMRGRRVDPKSETGTIVRRIEWVLLGMTLTLNVWPYLPGVWQHKWDPLLVIVHALGPIVAVLAVKGLPALYSILDALPLPTAAKYSANAVTADPKTVAKVRGLIAAGKLPAKPSAHKIRTTLECATTTARAIRDEIAAEGGRS